MTQNSLCPYVEKGVELLSKRWVVLIIYQLLEGGPQRFCTIESAFPISGRLLSERLKELEQEGIVRREVFPETPVRIQYSLTEKGLALENIIKGIESWSQEWMNVDRAEPEKI